MAPRIIPGERRNGQILLNDGYRYEKNRRIPGNKIYWRCTNELCWYPIQTNDFLIAPGTAIVILTPNPIVHPHGPELERISRQEFVQRVKDRVEEDPSLPLRQAYDTELVLLPANERADAPLFESVRSSLKRHRLSFVPQIPVDIYAVDIRDSWAETWDGNRKLLAYDNILGVCIFASDDELVTLSQCQQVHIDGTFRTAPHPYAQIVTIHGKYNGWHLPLVMALCTGKRQNQYRYILREVKRKITNLTNNPWQPTRIITDFEVALIAVIRRELPQTDTHGCYFHYCQSLMRKVTDLGLRAAYNNNAGVKRVIRRMLGLGYIPIPNVRMIFVTYIAGVRVQNIVQAYPNLRRFFQYIDTNYINGGVFTIPFWNVHNRTMDSRTNNYAEAFFSKWNRQLRVRHPNIWVVIRRIKLQGEITRLKVAQARRGDPRPRRRLKWRNLERRIQRLRRELNRGRRNLRSYWGAILYVVKTYA